MDYDLPDVIRVEADGPVRIVRLSRPEQLNAINDELHLGLTRLFPQLSADADARVAVITGEGRAFSAGGDFDLLDRMANDRALRRDVIAEGRELVLNMIRCRVPVVAAVNGPAVGLGCSVIALSDVVYMAESAYLSDPHVTVGLVAADGGPLTWPLHTSLLLAKEYAFTGDRISAQRAAEIGLANHVCPDGEVLAGRARGRAQDRRAAAAGRRGDQAGAEPARRARGARHDRLRDGGRDASRSTRPTSARTSTASSGADRPDEGELHVTLFDAFRYDGKRVLVVGGASGMGAAVAELVQDAGRRGRR